MNFFEGCKTKEEVKARHRELSKRWHPDTKDGDEETMKQINAAYEEALERIDAEGNFIIDGAVSGQTIYTEVHFVGGRVVYVQTSNTPWAPPPPDEDADAPPIDPLELYADAVRARDEKDRLLVVFLHERTLESQTAYINAANRYKEALFRMMGVV